MWSSSLNLTSTQPEICLCHWVDFVKSSYKPMLWVLIRIASPCEAILMSTHNISFYEEISKIITSSNMHLISSAAVLLKQCLNSALE